MANEKSPVDMLLKIKKFVDVLVKEKAKYGKKENVDVLVLLDQIEKRAASYLKENKKLLPIDIDNPEVSGSIGRAEYSERPKVVVSPQAAIKEVGSKEDFYKCVTVSNTELKKLIPEDRLEKIGEVSQTPIISLKFTGGK